MRTSLSSVPSAGDTGNQAGAGGLGDALYQEVNERLQGLGGAGREDCCAAAGCARGGSRRRSRRGGGREAVPDDGGYCCSAHWEQYAGHDHLMLEITVCSGSRAGGELDLGRCLHVEKFHNLNNTGTVLSGADTEVFR